jgi:tetratricopeptide (TPR) repeat protein
LSKYLQHFKKLTQENPESGEGLLGLGLCYLQSGLFPLAQQCFANAIGVSPELPQPYYYYALSRIAGRHLMTMSLNEIREIEQYLTTAVQLDGDSPIFKLLLACLKGDYYETNGLMVSPPTTDDLLAEISGLSIEKAEMEKLRNSVIIRDDSYFSTVNIK